MRSQCLVCVLLAGLAYGQAAQPATPPAAGAKAEQSTSAAPDKAPEANVGPNDAVITLKGFCADAAQQGDACKTAINRAQFEKLVEALQPGMPPALRRQLATRYSQVLKMSGAAEKRVPPKTNTKTRRTKLPTSKPPWRGFTFPAPSKSHLQPQRPRPIPRLVGKALRPDRKSTRLNSSHLGISYA